MSKHIYSTYLSTPVEYIGVGRVAVTQGGPRESQETLEEYSCVSDGTVRVGAHLSPIEKLPLFLLLQSFLGGHEPRA